MLLLTGAAVQDIFLVRAGEVHLMRHTRSGERLILHRAGPGAVLAEASAYAPRYHCDAVARGSVLVAALPKSRFLAALAADAALATDWAALLARATQAARLRAEIRSLPRVATRLEVWLEAGHTLPPHGQLQDLAAEPGVTRRRFTASFPAAGPPRADRPAIGSPRPPVPARAASSHSGFAIQRPATAHPR